MAEDNNKAPTTIDEVVDAYLNRGFGSMNKNDFEVWIFNHLLSNKFPDASDYKISVELKIPETKVKRLRYEAELKYSEVNEERRKEQLKQQMQNARFLKSNEGQIKFSIDDKVLRSYLGDVLRKEGRFYDSSFNSSIVALSVSDFLYLLRHLYPTDWEEELKDVKQDFEKGTDFPKSFAEVVHSTAEGSCRNLLKKFIGENASQDLIEYLKNKF